MNSSVPRSRRFSVSTGPSVSFSNTGQGGASSPRSLWMRLH
ncbi:hypothetical protein ACFYR1_19045 [Streptomyces canus]